MCCCCPLVDIDMHAEAQHNVKAISDGRLWRTDVVKCGRVEKKQSCFGFWIHSLGGEHRYQNKAQIYRDHVCFDKSALTTLLRYFWQTAREPNHLISTQQGR